VTLLEPPNPPPLLRDAPFLLTAWWWDYTAARWDWDRHLETDPPYFHIAAAEYPGDWPHEYVLGAQLATPIAQVDLDELPIALALRFTPDRGWHFEYLGGAEFFRPADVEPPPAPVAPTPMSPDQLSGQAEAMLRQSLGLGADDPLPPPAGELPVAEQPEAPYRFDPHPHMDLTKAEPPPAFHGEAPATAPPAAPPPPDARTSPAAPVPEPAPPGPAPASNAEPFVH
jgi:hypothetical protein